jgi:hypothetical protein
MLSHPKSKYSEVLAFARAHPLPSTAEGLADGLMDVAAMLIATKADSAYWTQLNLSIIYTHRANPYPGAFLSNPALLPDNIIDYPHGARSFGSLTAGAFFAYPHYQEDSLGQTLLLAAFSPRTRKPVCSASLYAQALLHLQDQGLIEKGGSHKHTLQALASGSVPLKERQHCSFNMVLASAHIQKATEIRTELGARAIECALSDDKAGLFTEATRARLLALVLSHEARARNQQTEEPTAAPTTSTTPARAKARI